jgi:hypothetical protein
MPHQLLDCPHAHAFFIQACRKSPSARMRRSPRWTRHVGLARDPPANSLHELGLGYQRANGKDYVVAKVRLFAEQKGPIYYVAVGESLETPTAKFKRVLSRRFFSMIA